MTAPQLEDDKLQQYFDGELSDAEAEAIRKELEASEDVQLRLSALSRLHDLIGITAEDIADDLPSDDLYAQIRAGIREQEEKGFGKGLKVIEGGAKDEPVEGWKVWIPVAGGFAVAAAVLFAVLLPNANTSDESATAETTVDVEESGMTVIEEGEIRVLGSEVEEVDFGTNTGTVFQVEGQAGEPIAVVWINDEPSEATQ